MRKPKAPCLNCTDRSIECHSNCNKYIAYKKDCVAYQNMKDNADYLDSLYKASPQAVDTHHNAIKKHRRIV